MLHLDSPIVIFLHLTFSFTELLTREFKFFPMFHMLPSFFLLVSIFSELASKNLQVSSMESFFK